MNPSNPINLLTVDLEDYFQVHAFSSVIRYEDWDNYESRLERNTDRLLEILNNSISHQPSAISHLNSPCAMPSAPCSLSPCAYRLAPHGAARATFFVLGWIAERYPSLIRRIQNQGHEIASHGYAHQLIYNQTIVEFREDIRKAKAILEDITGSEVIGYRAPSYSITNKSQWAFKVLMEEGFKYDSSLFPIHHDFYGFPNAPRFPFVISMNGSNNFEFQMLNFDLQETQSSVNPTNSSNPINPSNPSASPQHNDTPHSAFRIPHSIVEFPLSTVRLFGQNIPISGGGYFRLFPYPIIRKGLKRINEQEKQPFIFYIHPWELDFEQPRIDGARWKSQFRHYVNLNKTEDRFKKLLADFRFSAISDVLNGNTAVVQPLLTQQTQ
jgi:polysaccharide deacetylase family protein (PEP-CTERM system associated)